MFVFVFVFVCVIVIVIVITGASVDSMCHELSECVWFINGSVKHRAVQYGRTKVFQEILADLKKVSNQN